VACPENVEEPGPGQQHAGPSGSFHDSEVTASSLRQIARADQRADASRIEIGNVCEAQADATLSAMEQSLNAAHEVVSRRRAERAHDVQHSLFLRSGHRHRSTPRRRIAEAGAWLQSSERKMRVSVEAVSSASVVWTMTRGTLVSGQRQHRSDASNAKVFRRVG
jgi:hypothetical protein